MLFSTWTLDDILELHELEKVIFPKDAWSIYALHDALNCDTFYGATLKNDGEIVGYYGYYSIPPECYIANIAVAPKYQGHGYGDKLLINLLANTMSKSLTDCTLEARVSNVKAINLYKKHGFIQEGLRKKYYGDGEDAVIMWRREK